MRLQNIPRLVPEFMRCKVRGKVNRVLVQKGCIIFLCSLAYAVIFRTSFLHLQDTIASTFSLFFIISISYLWGRVAGLSMALVNLFWTSIIIRRVQIETEDLASIHAALGISIQICSALIVGTISTLNKKLKKEVTERQQIEKQLKSYQNHLEEMVQKRTLELKTANDRLRHAEKMEAIGQLAGGVAHDFNNQLTIVLGYCEILASRLKDNPQLTEYVNHIQSSGKRASDLTKQLLAFARKGVYKSLPVDLNSTAKEIAALLSRSLNKNISIECRTDALQPLVWGGATQLQNAILNLALNARDAMTQGGILTIETRNINIDQPFCAKHDLDLSPGIYVTITVQDTGSGIDSSTMKHIFEPFFTTKEEGKGTGMGLAAVYGIVKSHKGAVTVNSTPGMGSTFTMYFPVTAKTKSAPVDAIMFSNPQQKLNVLIIDDEKEVAKTVSDMLFILGYAAKAICEPEKAINYYRNNWKSIDLVIIDMIMPGMDGKETFNTLKQINPEIKAIISSGYALTKEIEEILKQGARAFLQKPYDQIDLARQILQIFKKKCSDSNSPSTKICAP